MSTDPLAVLRAQGVEMVDAVEGARETSAKLDHTLRAYGRLETRHYEVLRELRAAKARIAELEAR